VVEYCNLIDDEAMKATRKLITQVQQAEDSNVVGPQGWFKKVTSVSKIGRKLNFAILSPSNSNASAVVSRTSVSSLPRYGETTTLSSSTAITTRSKDNYHYGYGTYDEKEDEPPAPQKSNYDDSDDSLYRPYSFNDFEQTLEKVAVERRKNTKTAGQWKDSFVSVFALPTSPTKHMQLETLLTELESVHHEFSTTDQQVSASLSLFSLSFLSLFLSLPTSFFLSVLSLSLSLSHSLSLSLLQSIFCSITKKP